MHGLVIGYASENREPERRGDLMRYFTIRTIQTAITHLQKYDSSWIVPAFVFAANDIGEEGGSLKRKGTDNFLDQFFHGSLIGLPPAPNGKNLMRPRFRDVEPWQIDREFMGDYVVRQGTKAWANIYSSRGYRDMKLRGEIEMAGSSARLKSKSGRHSRMRSQIRSGLSTSWYGSSLSRVFPSLLPIGIVCWPNFTLGLISRKGSVQPMKAGLPLRDVFAGQGRRTPALLMWNLPST